MTRVGNYRPITDVWILARTKLLNGQSYYGSYPAGFLHRARALMGVHLTSPLLHICGGKLKHYPYSGYGPNDRTLDLDPACEPDFLGDARDPFPLTFNSSEWAGVLIDAPYSPEDAAHYAPGPSAYPLPNQLLRHGLAVVPVGGRVGMLHYVWPQPPAVTIKAPGKPNERVPLAKEVAVVAVGTGRNARARWFTVWEKLEQPVQAQPVTVDPAEPIDDQQG